MSQTYAMPPAYGVPQQPQQVTYGMPQQPQQVIYGAPAPQQVYASPQPPLLNSPYNPQGAPGVGPPQPWANPFCGTCSPCGLCCKAYWCPCFVFGKAHHRLRDPSMKEYSSFNLACLGYYAALHFGFAWVPQMMQRGELRAKYNLKGSSCGDCCRSYWCSWRELFQEEKELRLLTQGQQQPLQTPQLGYQNVPEGMTYVPKQ